MDRWCSSALLPFQIQIHMNMKTDQIGQLTLESLEKAKIFNCWMVEQFEKQLVNPVLEIGSGIGNITKILLEKEFNVTATDIDEGYLNLLVDRYGHLENLQGIECLDLESPQDSLKDIFFNTVLLINVLEHIKNPTYAIQKAVSKLNDGGRIVVLVPAGHRLYCRLDSALGHIKRYNKRILTEELMSAGLRIEKMKYFNCMGILGWFVWGKIFNGKYLNQSLIKTYEGLMPINRILDEIIGNKIGLSLIAVATKK